MDTKKLRQKILDLAIHGKLVPQDPNDEPASVLLERIRAEKEQLIKEGKIKKSRKTSSSSDTPHYEQVPFEVPVGWKSVPVSELFCLNPKSEIADDTSVGFIPMACVNDGFSGNHQFEKRIWKEVKKGYCHFQNGDIGIAKISPCFENLKSTIFQNLPNNYGAGTTELVILRPLIIHAKFYLYLFKSQWYISEGTKYFKGVVGQQRVHKGIFSDLQIPLPPLTEQYRIVAEIEKWFALIDQIEQRKADLQTAIKQTKSRILDLAIHGKLVPQDPNDEPASELLKRINPKVEITCDNAQYGNLPNGWLIVDFNSIFETISSKPYQIKQSQIQSHGIRPVVSQSMNHIEGYTDEANYLHLQSPVLVFGDHTRIVKYIDFDFVVGADGVKIINPLFYQRYAYYMILYASINIEDKGYSRHFCQIAKFTYCLPPLKEQIRIVAQIEELYAQLDKIESSLQA